MAGGEVGCGGGLVDVTCGEIETVAVLVRMVAGVMGRLVGVDTVFCGTWQANILRKSTIKALMIGL
jgi:hypothetical protein